MPSEERATFVLYPDALGFASDGTARPEGVARVYEATLMASGAANGWVIPAETLGTSLPRWEGASMYVDHPDFFSDPSVRDLVGVVRWPRFDADRVKAEAHLMDIRQAQDAVELLDTLIKMRQAGDSAPRIGLSAVLSIDWEVRGERRVVTEIKKVWSVDLVFEPAAQGDVHRILNSLRSNHMSNESNQPGARHGDAAPTATVTAAAQTSSNVSQTSPVPAAPGLGNSELSLALQRAEQEQTEAVQRAQCAQLLEMRLATANLPAGITDLVRAHFTGLDGQARIFSPAELDAEVVRARAAAAAVVAPDSIRDMGHPVSSGRLPAPIVNAMWSDLDRLQAAYERLMGYPVEAQFSTCRA